jgi:small subunit ribosomal protein S1
LIHISELADEPVTHPRDVVSEGDDLEVRILRIEPERRRLGLSVKQVPDDLYRPEADRVREEAESFEEIFESQSE